MKCHMYVQSPCIQHASTRKRTLHSSNLLLWCSSQGSSDLFEVEILLAFQLLSYVFRPSKYGSIHTE